MASIRHYESAYFKQLLDKGMSIETIAILHAVKSNEDGAHISYYVLDYQTAIKELERLRDGGEPSGPAI